MNELLAWIAIIVAALTKIGFFLLIVLGLLALAIGAVQLAWNYPAAAIGLAIFALFLWPLRRSAMKLVHVLLAVIQFAMLLWPVFVVLFAAFLLLRARLGY